MLHRSLPPPTRIDNMNLSESPTTRHNLSRQSSKSKSGGCCRGFSSVRTVSSTAPTLQHHHLQQLYQKLELKVAGLEKEVQRQTELRVMYRKRMEKTQDYLKYCLQIAQQNGILDLIIHSNGEVSQSSISSPRALNSTLTPSHNHPNLIPIVDQAKINGWFINPSEIQLGEKIGQGTTAEIHRGTWRGFDVAVKCMSDSFFSKNENGVIFFAQEVETLSKQRHRFVLDLMGACLDPPHHAWVVTEYLNTTLKEWLHGPGKRPKHRTTPLPPLKERVMRALEIAQGMQYLHEQKPKVIHRDLKPSNIFLDDALHVRVADFGHARFLDDDEMALTGETGTYVYMAPEVIRCEPYDEKCDVYSFGIILNELLTGNYPYIETQLGPAKIAMEVVEDELRPLLASKDDGEEMEELIDLICLCWNASPSTRPSFATISHTLKSYVESLLQISN
ncbi:serine/threonine-protein kinase STY17-like isoform X2 [Vigna unguiculata]|uniref:Protein kinase n=1 Tax=Vigna unguiculata TaxID=3917 RepID=A0A4D6NUJ4_VIGUN|nr:serine/threonine-protein kinase STY17-like isoform X2 [Vigna unguiculata]QCE16364.1 Protein kinase [Vigna unguiculata]